MSMRTIDVNAKISDRVFGFEITDYFSESKNLRKQVKQKANDSAISKINDHRTLSLALKDGAEQLFATNGFDLFDYTPNLPLSSFFYPEFMPIRFGGGLVERVNAVRFNYQLGERKLAGDKTNLRPLGEVKEQKIQVPTYAFTYATSITEFELMKTSHLNYDLYGYRVETVRMAYQREIEWMAFKGNEGINGIDSTSPDFHGGLLNNALATSSDYSGDWDTKDLDVNTELKFWSGILNDMMKTALGNVDFFPDTALVPFNLYSRYLEASVVGQVPTGAGNGTGIAVSLLDYLEKQLSALVGKPFRFRRLMYLDVDTPTTAGITAYGEYDKGMAVVYRNNERTIRTHITLPLTGGATYMTDAGLRQNYLAIISTPLVIYPIIRYVNNGGSVTP